MRVAGRVVGGARGAGARERAAAVVLLSLLVLLVPAGAGVAAQRVVAAPEHVDGIALDGWRGGAVLAWAATQDDGATALSWAEVGPRGGVVPHGVLLPAAPDLTLQGLDVAPSGAAIACATQRTPGAYRTWIAQRATAAASFEVVELELDPLADPVACGVADDGRAVVAWAAEDGLRAVGVSADGRPGVVARLTRDALSSAPRLAVAPDGSAAIGFLSGGGGPLGVPLAAQTAHVVRRAADGRWAAARRLGGAAPRALLAPAVATPLSGPLLAWQDKGVLRATGGGAGSWSPGAAGAPSDADPLALAAAGDRTLLAWRAPSGARVGDDADEDALAWSLRATLVRGSRVAVERRAAQARRARARAARQKRARAAGGRAQPPSATARRARIAREKRARAARVRSRAQRRAGGARTRSAAREDRRARARRSSARRTTTPLGAVPAVGPLQAALADDGTGAVVWGTADEQRQTLRARTLGPRGRWSAPRTVATAPTLNPGSGDGTSFGYEQVAVAALPGGRTLVAFTQPQRDWRQQLIVATVGGARAAEAARGAGAARRKRLASRAAEARRERVARRAAATRRERLARRRSEARR